MYRTNIVHKIAQINAGQKSSGTNSNFSINFNSRDLDRVTSVTAVKISLPRLFQNIWSKNNIIDIQHPLGIDNFFTIAPGQYTVTTLVTALNTATAGINVSWVYNTTTNRFSATYSGVGSAYLISNPALSTVANYIGLTADVTLGAPSDLPSPPQLSGPDEVYVQSQLVGNTSCVAAGTQTSIPLIGTINFTNVPYGFVGRTDIHQLELMHIEYPYQTIMRRIDVLLTDPYGNELSLPDNCFLDMILQFSYIPI